MNTNHHYFLISLKYVSYAPDIGILWEKLEHFVVGFTINLIWNLGI